MYQGMIVDDAAIMRMRLREILEPDFRIVAEAADGEEALQHYGVHRPDFLTLDITMPNLGGIEAARQIKLDYPDIKIMILTVHKEKEYLQRAVSAGAQGYVLKEDTDTELFSAIKTMREGGVYISPRIPAK